MRNSKQIKRLKNIHKILENFSGKINRKLGAPREQFLDFYCSKFSFSKNLKVLFDVML